MTIFWPLTKRVVCPCTHEHLPGTKRQTGPEVGGAGGGEGKGGRLGGRLRGGGGWGGGRGGVGGLKGGATSCILSVLAFGPHPLAAGQEGMVAQELLFCFIKGKAPRRARSARQ